MDFIASKFLMQTLVYIAILAILLAILSQIAF